MTVALVLAAGSGERLGAALPKAYVELAGRPMLAWSLRALVRVPGIERIVLVTPPSVDAGGHQRGERPGDHRPPSEDDERLGLPRPQAFAAPRRDDDRGGLEEVSRAGRQPVAPASFSRTRIPSR